MKKMLKIVAMILVVAAVVFAAGCAGKTDNAENQTQTSSAQVNSTPAEVPSTAETPASIQTSAPSVTPSVTNGNATENVTGNTTLAQTGTHISNEQRKRAIALNHTLSSGTITVNSSQ
jgi:inhibitor of cysteine peptidase